MLKNSFTYRMRKIISRQHNRIKALNDELDWYEEQLKRAVETDQACQRMLAIPGVGGIVAHAIKVHMKR